MYLRLVTQSYPILCDPMDCSPPAPVSTGILRAGMLEWVAYLFSRGTSWSRNQTRVSCTAGGFFTSWATQETLLHIYFSISDDPFLNVVLEWSYWNQCFEFLMFNFFKLVINPVKVEFLENS